MKVLTVKEWLRWKKEVEKYNSIKKRMEAIEASDVSQFLKNAAKNISDTIFDITGEEHK